MQTNRKSAREELLESAERFLKACLEAQAATEETLKILEEMKTKKIYFKFDGHEVEMKYTYRKGNPAPRVVNERTYLTPPDPAEFEVNSLKVDGEEKDINISEEYLLEQAEAAERDAEIAMQEIRYDAYREERF